MLRFHLVRTAGGLFATLALVAGFGVAVPRPASAVNVTLKATPAGTTPGQTIQLTATTDQHVDPPFTILIYDRYYLTLLPGGACTDCTSRTVPLTMSTLVGRGAVSYVAVVGTFSPILDGPGQQILARSQDNCCDPSWLNPPKLYAFRHPDNLFGAVKLQIDDEGAIGAWNIEFFKVSCSPACSNGQPGARLPVGCNSITNHTCSVFDAETSAATYQAIVSTGDADVISARKNPDARAASYLKCVDASDISSPPLCMQFSDPLAGH